MNWRIAFRPEAAADVRAAFRWYEAQRPGLGHEFEATLDAELTLLRAAPTAFPIVFRQLRKLLLRRFPYAVYYEIEPEMIRIRAVLHLRQHPRRWRSRA